MANATNLGGKHPNGLAVGGVPLVMSNPGKVFYVHDNDTTHPHASDGNAGTTRELPLATIDAAIGKCVAGRGDVILVLPGHAESIVAAGGIALDVSGVAIVGLGEGDNRPVITFATAAAASITVTGGNNLIANMVFKCNIASQNHMLDIAADDVRIADCDFREGSATGLAFITADTADGDSDRLTIERCKFHAPTAGNYDAAIQLAKDHTGVVIKDCDIYGDFDDACISVPAGGNAQVNLLIQNVSATNVLTGQHAIEINGTGNTGSIVDCRLAGDTLAAIVDTGGLAMFETYVHDLADQSYAIVTGTVVS